jgi:hypothetical protein
MAQPASTPPIRISCWAELMGPDPHVRVHVAHAPGGAVLIDEDAGTRHSLGAPNGLDCAMMWTVADEIPAFRAARVPADPYAGKLRLRLEAAGVDPVRFRTHWEPWPR